MVKIQEAEQQIVTHYEVYDRRPADSDLVVAAIELHEQQFGHAPKLMTTDAGFFSAANEAAARELGVKRISMPNRSSKSPQRRLLERKRWRREAQRWRTGCEGRISGRCQLPSPRGDNYPVRLEAGDLLMFRVSWPGLFP